MEKFLDKLLEYQKQLDDQTNELGLQGQFSKASAISFQSDRVQRLICEIIELDDIMKANFRS